MIRSLSFLFSVLLVSTEIFAQGFGLPSRKGGIGFGNLPNFTGIRFNFKDKNVERINGINVTVWQTKDDEAQTGTMNGIALGLPMAMGTENFNGLGIGILGVGAKKNISGINVGGLGVGAGGNASGFNFGGLGVGAGGDLIGINIGGLGVGSGGDVTGLNFGGLGVGAGGRLRGVNAALLGVGSGGGVSGINIGGLGVGSGESLSGITIGGLGVGAGAKVRGIAFGGLGVGAGEEIKGLAASVLAVGSPKITAIAVAPIVGGLEVRGLLIAPAYLRVGGDKNDDTEGTMKGISVSAFNHIKGEQKGVAFGVVNYTRRIKGVQFGLINIIKENPKGLRVLPLLNMRFGKKTDDN